MCAGRELSWDSDECQQLPSKDDKLCNLLCIHHSYDTCDGICFEHWPYVMELTKWVMRFKFMHSTYRPERPLVFKPQHYNVAWHIRTGDVMLHWKRTEYFKHIAQQVRQI